MSTDEEQGGGTVGASRSRIISVAQERCHEARRAFIELENSIGSGDQSRVAAAEFHNAVVEYFYGLRPLKEESAVREFWENVVLWEEQTTQWQDGELVNVPVEVCGFDELERQAIKKRVVEEEHTTMLGTQMERKEVPVRLPPAVLLRVSAKLDMAAAQLGFKPDVEDNVIDTILEEDAESLTEVDD